ncbi:MAG: sporulation transcriptional regulator SpoIIID [Clostridia bacterium]|nr:sporulation transcriptional regulator SpoIIID [Clostridia bacterium]
MQKYINDRIIEEALYILDNNATIRKTAQVFHLGKSTVHKDVSIYLKSVDKRLYREVKKVLEYNLSVRHIRGGEATRRKYRAEKKR